MAVTSILILFCLFSSSTVSLQMSNNLPVNVSLDQSFFICHCLDNEYVKEGEGEGEEENRVFITFATTYP